jgi:hypothetical protein
MVLFPINFAKADKTNEIVDTLNRLIDTFTITIDVKPVSQENREKCGLRSIFLYTSSTMLLEPPALCPNGEPISAAVQITKEEASRIITLLAEANILEQAEKYYSERTPTVPETSVPPANAVNIRNRKSIEIQVGGYTIRLNVFDQNWYTYYENSFEWTKKSKEFLLQIESAIEGEAKKQINALLIQIE